MISIAFLMLVNATNSSTLQSIRFKKSSLKRISVYQDVAIFEEAALSAEHCGLQCAYYKSCVTFTFVASEGKCQGRS